MPRQSRDEMRADDRPQRRKRGKISGARSKIYVSSSRLDPNYEYRIVNDEPGRVQNLYDRDYDFVTTDEVGPTGQSQRDSNEDLGNRVSWVVGRGGDGRPMRAYLMKIRKDFYEEDQEEKLEPVRQADEAILSGKPYGGGAEGLADKSYRPAEHRVRTTMRRKLSADED